MKKILLIVGGVLVAIVVVVFAGGAMLPQNHTVRSEITTAAAPDVAWSVITDYRNSPSWRPDVEKVEPAPAQNGHDVWVERYKSGEKMTLEDVEVRGPTRLVRKIVDKDLPYGGVWTFEITPDGSGSKIAITEDGEVYNPAFRFIGKFILGNDMAMKQFLKELDAKLKSAGRV